MQWDIVYSRPISVHTQESHNCPKHFDSTCVKGKKQDCQSNAPFTIAVYF